MKVLVTGGAGFIGSNLVYALVQKGYDVVIIDNLTTGRFDNLKNLNIKFHEGDIRDTNLLNKISKDVQIVFHLAANVGNVKSIENPSLDSDINVLGTINVLQAMKVNNIQKIVYSSSAATFGELVSKNVNEEHTQNPLSPYGVSKLSAEKMVLCYGKLFGFKAICLRYFNAYGINQYFDSYGNVIPIFANNILKNKYLKIYGDGEQTRDFVNVKDIVNANLLAAENYNESNVFNIGYGEETTINVMANMILKVSGSKVKIEYEKERLGEVRNCVADITKARELLNYEPMVTIENGIEGYWEWYRRVVKS